MMTAANHDLLFIHRPLPRDVYLRVVQASLLAGRYRFAREAVLNWLANYPGDLMAGLFYGQALLGENRQEQALVVLEGLCAADPEFLEAVEMLLRCISATSMTTVRDENSSDGHPESIAGTQNHGSYKIRRESQYYAHAFALTGQSYKGETLAEWGRHLWLARQALKQRDIKQSEAMILKALSADGQTSLAAVTHLAFLAENRRIPVQTRCKLAAHYIRRWPKCLACSLWLADWLMESGESGQAVALLHQAAARDISAQVAVRLWGEDHPYRRMWPERLELPLGMPLPVDVAIALGWNLLPGNEKRLLSIDDRPDKTAESTNDVQVDQYRVQQKLKESVELLNAFERETQANGTPLNAPVDTSADTPAGDDRQLLEKMGSEELRSIQKELERLAARLHVPGVTHLDGRYPVYVVFSVRSQLQKIYGKQAADELQAEMLRLVQAVRKQRDWGARLFLADDPMGSSGLGVKPAQLGDPWELKLALVDLDALLAKRGEMIGALLIVGGPEIVPFHHLPNPIDDQDVDVPSDNPYATRDENYFIPEWPVGRLPGGAGGDARLLMAALRRITAGYITHTKPQIWYRRWWRALTGWLRPGSTTRERSFGYTAAIWRQAASSVFRPIGEPRELFVSPPLGLDGDDLAISSKGRIVQRGCRIEFHPVGVRSPDKPPSVAHSKISQSKGGRQSFGNERLSPADVNGGIPPLIGQLAYFNLHGLEDAAEWYGQRDPMEPGDGPDYPVALRPQDVGNNQSTQKSSVPQVIFSEACYGAHILEKQVDEAIALKFLEAGSKAVLGSTCMAYGSLDMPLIAADLLGQAFWRFLRQGLPAGDAFRRAKIHLAREMHRRQGYLDGEDQKTLISFVLYGDPLAQPVGIAANAKSMQRLVRPLSRVETVCDRAPETDNLQPIPTEVMEHVKQVVAQYLPGMTEAQVVFSQERVVCNGNGHICPTSQLQSTKPNSGNEKSTCKARNNRHKAHRRVTLSKQVKRNEHVHTHYARLTFDEQGKVVKVVVSK